MLTLQMFNTLKMLLQKSGYSFEEFLNRAIGSLREYHSDSPAHLLYAGMPIQVLTIDRHNTIPALPSAAAMAIISLDEHLSSVDLTDYPANCTLCKSLISAAVYNEYTSVLVNGAIGQRLLITACARHLGVLESLATSYSLDVSRFRSTRIRTSQIPALGWVVPGLVYRSGIITRNFRAASLDTAANIACNFSAHSLSSVTVDAGAAFDVALYLYAWNIITGYAKDAQLYATDAN